MSQQSYQVIGQHNIIKNQETKIQELKEELKVAATREEARYLQIVQNNKIALTEKEKTIQFLKQQLEKALDKQLCYVDEYNNKLDQGRERLEQQIMVRDNKYMQLESKLNKLEKQSQIQVQALRKQNRILEEQNSLMKKQILKVRETNTNLSIEMEKVNSFCKNLIQDKDSEKKKEILLWVGKFTDYMEKCKKQERKELEDMSKFVKDQINSLKESLGAIVNEIAKNENELLLEKVPCEEGVQSLMITLKEQCKGILEENQKFWNKVVKEGKERQKEKALKNEMKNYDQKYKKQIQQLQKVMEVYSAEKKTLANGFQKIKFLNESRQAIYQEEIKQHKKTIEGLIEAGSQRDQEFTNEIKTMSCQIERITEKYYNNLEVPILKIKEKMNQSIEQIKIEVQKITSSSSLKNSMITLQQLLTLYVEKDTKQKSYQDLSHNIFQLAKIVQLGTPYSSYNQSIQPKLTWNYKQSSRLQKWNRQSLESIDDEMQYSFKQKLNRDHYQLLRAQKNFAKLKEHCDSLQKNNEIGDNQSRRIIELEAQNEALKQSIQYMKEQHSEEIQKMKLFKDNHKNQYGFIDKVKELIMRIQKHLRQQNQHFVEVKEHLKILSVILLKPMQQYQVLIKQASQINLASVVDPLSMEKGQNSNKYHYKSCFSFSDEIKMYKEIMSTKNDNYLNTRKLVGELIKRLTESNNVKELKKQDTNEHKQQSCNKKIQLVQKKIRDIQCQRVKQKQEMITKIEKIQLNLWRIVAKINTLTVLKTNLQKLLANIEKKIDQISSKSQIKQKNTEELDLLRDNVLADLKEKLEEANYQNEKLRNQMSLLFNSPKV